jgi:hypothetical protein
MPKSKKNKETLLIAIVFTLFIEQTAQQKPHSLVGEEKSRPTKQHNDTITS